MYFASLAIDFEEKMELDISAAFSKTAILSSVFALEAAVNALIDSLELSKSKADDVDHWGIIEKYRFYFERRKPGQKFNRSAEEVKVISDLVEFRHRQVHSKLDLQPLHEEPDGTYRYPQIETSPHLQIPFRPMFVESANALVALKAVDEFLERYLLDWCGMDTDEAMLFLLHQTCIPELPPFVMTTPVYKRVESEFTRFGLNLKYIDRKRFSVTMRRGGK